MSAKSLFSPFDLRNVTLSNRFVMPAMQRGWCTNGCPSDRMVDYYRQRAAGGVSLIIGESAAIDHPSATGQPNAARIYGAAIDGWARCVQAVHAEGAHMLIQLWHEGAVRKNGLNGVASLSPSGLVNATTANGSAATHEQLRELRQAFVEAAVAAQQIGAAGVEVHAAHGFLLDEFLWRHTNRREDGYGGDDIRDRVRFPAEIVTEIRDAVGNDFVISFRFSQWKEVDYAARVAETPAELAVMLGALRDAGADVIHPSARRFYEPAWPESDLGLSGWAKRTGGLPVIAVGSVGLDQDVVTNLSGVEARPTGDAGLRELQRRFENDEFDLVAIGRASIGDPRWVDKVRTGQVGELGSMTKDDVRGASVWDLEVTEEARRQRAR